MNSIEYDFGDSKCARVAKSHFEQFKALQSLEDQFLEDFNVEFNKELNQNQNRKKNQERPEHFTAAFDQVPGVSNGAYSSLLEVIGHKYDPLFQLHNSTPIFRDTFRTSQPTELRDDLFMNNQVQAPVKYNHNLISDNYEKEHKDE